MSAPLSDDCAWLLDLQRGVIARWQAAAVGLDPRAIEALLRTDRWRPIYRGIYAAYTGSRPASLSFDDAFSWLSRGCGRRLLTPLLLHEAVGKRSRVRWRGEILAALP